MRGPPHRRPCRPQERSQPPRPPSSPPAPVSPRPQTAHIPLQKNSATISALPRRVMPCCSRLSCAAIGVPARRPLQIAPRPFRLSRPATAQAHCEAAPLLACLSTRADGLPCCACACVAVSGRCCSVCVLLQRRFCAWKGRVAGANRPKYFSGRFLVVLSTNGTLLSF